VHVSAGLDFSTFKSSKKALFLLILLQNEAMEFHAMFKKAYKTCVKLMVLKVRCDQRSKLLIFAYTCEKSTCGRSAAAAAGFKDSDLGRSYISLLEPVCRASMLGKNVDIYSVFELKDAPCPKNS
jgi:hypothetical protein